MGAAEPDVSRVLALVWVKLSCTHSESTKLLEYPFNCGSYKLCTCGFTAVSQNPSWQSVLLVPQIYSMKSYPAPVSKAPKSLFSAASWSLLTACPWSCYSSYYKSASCTMCCTGCLTIQRTQHSLQYMAFLSLQYLMRPLSLSNLKKKTTISFCTTRTSWYAKVIYNVGILACRTGGTMFAAKYIVVLREPAIWSPALRCSEMH